MSLDLPIIHEDEALVVVNKPAGVVVNRAETVQGETVQEWMEERYKIQEIGFSKHEEDEVKIFKKRSGLGHRIDKDTSGVLVLAKDPSSLAKVMGQFKEREVEKEYIALVHGKLEPRKGFVRLPIARSSEDRERFCVDPMGKLSLTYYQVEEYYRSAQFVAGVYEQGFSLVRCMPKTGRTHQLRVHLNHLGHPLVGDERYLSKKRFKADEEWCQRQFLHAHKLRLKHPVTFKKVEFEAPLAEDLKESLTTLQMWEDDE